MIKLKKITPEETYKLRLKVLKTCEEYEYKYQNDFDDTTVHFGAFRNEENIGIVSVMENNHPYFKGKQMQLRGMAVLNSEQGNGVGNDLIKALIKESVVRKSDLIWCNARDYSVKFYEKQGFKTKGEKFFIKNVCDHYVMFLQL